MPILWFEQHVKMGEDIADEVKMILNLPRLGQIMGIVFIFIGVSQIMLLPIKNFISQQCCASKVNAFDKNDKIDALDVIRSPEISPLITEKPKNGIVVNSENVIFRNQNRFYKEILLKKSIIIIPNVPKIKDNQSYF